MTLFPRASPRPIAMPSARTSTAVEPKIPDSDRTRDASDKNSRPSTPTYPSSCRVSSIRRAPACPELGSLGSQPLQLLLPLTGSGNDPVNADARILRRTLCLEPAAMTYSDRTAGNPHRVVQRPGLRTTHSGQKLVHDLTTYIGEPEVTPLKPVGQPRVVDPEAVKDRRLHIMYMHRVLLYVVTEVITLSIR